MEIGDSPLFRVLVMTTPLPSGPAENADDEAHAALKSLVALRKKMSSASQSHLDVSRIHPSYRDSAANLLDYLVLRRHDIRPLQTQLTSLGLSSLGRSERDVRGSVDRVISVLERMTSRAVSCGNEGQKRPPKKMQYRWLNTARLSSAATTVTEPFVSWSPCLQKPPVIMSSLNAWWQRA